MTSPSRPTKRPENVRTRAGVRAQPICAIETAIVTAVSLMALSRPLTAHSHFFSADLRRAECGDDVVGERLGDLHERKVVSDFNRPDRPRRDACFTGDCSNQITRADAALSAGAEEQTDHRSA